MSPGLLFVLMLVASVTTGWTARTALMNLTAVSPFLSSVATVQSVKSQRYVIFSAVIEDEWSIF